MLFRSIFIIAVLINLVCVIFVQSEQENSLSLNQFKPKFPSMNDEEASQWLSARSIPRRWHSQHSSRSSHEIARLLKKIQELNDNGIRQYETKSFEGVSMEVIFEAASKPN